MAIIYMHIYIYIFFNLKIICLRGGKACRALFWWIIPQMLKLADTGPGGSHEPGSQSGSPTLVAGTQVLEPSPAPSQVAH